MKFFQNLNKEDFREMMAMIILVATMGYLFLPAEWSDTTTRGSMLALLGTMMNYYFGDRGKDNNNDDNKPHQGLT